MLQQPPLHSLGAPFAVVPELLLFGVAVLIASCSADGGAELSDGGDGIRGPELKADAHPNTVVLELEYLDLFQPTPAFVGLPPREQAAAGAINEANFAKKRQQVCLGVMVRPNLLLTAKHCLDLPQAYPLPHFKMRLSRQPVAQPELDSEASFNRSFAWHDLHVFRHSTADLAFVQLPERITSFRALKFADELDSSRVYADGREQIVSEGHSQPGEKLLRAYLQIADHVTFPVPFTGAGSLGDEFVQMTYVAHWLPELRTIMDFGDSGGPLYSYDQHGDAVLYGIQSSIFRSLASTTDELQEDCATLYQYPSLACRWRFASLTAVGTWINDVLACAADERLCRRSVAATRSRGHGMRATMLEIERDQCPTKDGWVGPAVQYSMTVAQATPDPVALVVPFEGSYAIQYLHEADFRSAALTGGFNAYLSVDHDLMAPKVAPVVYPDWLEVTDLNPTISGCVVKAEQKTDSMPLGSPHEVPVDFRCPAEMREVLRLHYHPQFSEDYFDAPHLIDTEIALPTGGIERRRDHVKVELHDAETWQKVVEAAAGEDITSFTMVGVPPNTMKLSYSYACMY